MGTLTATNATYEVGNTCMIDRDLPYKINNK